MEKYRYKKFKIYYDIKKGNDSYFGDGYIIYNLNNKISQYPRFFHTEYKTKNGTVKSLKKMINDYIDFEWKENNFPMKIIVREGRETHYQSDISASTAVPTR